MTQAAIDFIKTAFGQTTELPVHFCSLGNERDGKHPFRKLDTRDLSELAAFIAKWDQPERGLFYCVSTLKQGAKARNKENAAELSFLFADVDLKDVDETVESIEKKLKALRKPPSIIIRSGNGVHALWQFKEALEVHAEGMLDRLEAALRQLADIVGGDLQVCEVARLMRLPGTHNTKNGEFKEVVVTHQSASTYELDDLEEWFGEQSPIILRKARAHAKTVGQVNPDEDGFDEYARLGFKPPIDVKARLDSMMFMGGGDAAVHKTQTDVASSMVARGHEDEEIVKLLLAATKAAAGDYGKRWNWRAEERNIRKDLVKWRQKLAKEGKTPTPRINNETASGSHNDQNNGSNVVSMAAAATALKPKPQTKQDSTAIPDHVRLADAVATVIQGRGEDMIFTEKAAWFYHNGLWTMATDGLSFLLNQEISRGAKVLGITPSNKLRSEVRGHISSRPDLCRREVRWDAHGMVPTVSGLINPRTLECRPSRPNDYVTWRIETPYDPTATCPWWLQMLEDAFEDRALESRQATVNVIQELLGVGLIDTKPRGLSRALIFQGGSNFGKSGLLEVLGGLFGSEQNSTPIEALEGAHGLMPFIKRQPWVLHEAFDQRKWHFSSAVKAIVTGEPIAVNIKNGPMLSLRINAPIFWGTNHPPQFKESTKAITNRLVVIECKREFFEDAPVGAAVEAFSRGFAKPSSLVLETEMPGLLTWALAGLQRALERGFLSLTSEMSEVADEIRKDSNLVAGFLEECCNYDMDRRLSVPDFCLAFAAWFLQNKGENRQVPSNDSISKALIAMADNLIAINSKELRDNRRRYYAGIALNVEGLAFHQAGFESRELQGKVANATAPGGQVNEIMSDEWLLKPSVSSMRARALSPENRQVSRVTTLDTSKNTQKQVSPQVSPPKF